MQLKKWHSTEKEEVLEILKSSELGLDEKEVKLRQEKYGKNELPKGKTPSLLKIFIEQLLDPIVLLLVVAMIFSILIKENTDAIAIAFIILVDLILGTFQEWKANKNVEALKKLIEIRTKIIRSGKEIEVYSSDIVPGDIVLLSSGDKISADLRLIEVNNLTIDESVLTGESTSVSKISSAINKDVILAERKNMAYAGTSVLSGRGVGIVTATGLNTELGEIAQKVNTTKDTKSPLTIRMEKFSKQITFLVVAIAIIITVVLYSKGTSGSEIFLSVIALSVSAMPEGLPLALTMALTIGSNRMSKNNVIVKKLNSVESLGSCTVIATDKTGTLTVNEQTAKKIVLPDNSIFDIEGTGYNDKGKIIPLENANIEDAKYISKLGVLNNEASLKKVKDGYEYFGDSIDIAFLALGQKSQINIDDIEITNRINYESENKYSAVFYKENGNNYCTVKGSLEKVLEFCTTMKVNNKNKKLDIEKIKKQHEDLASSGYRVIALASGKTKSEKPEHLTFEGLVAFIDPVREEVTKSISDCKKAGIKVIMITGDHPLTAYSIAKDLGLVENYDEVTSGKELDEYFQKGKKEFDKFVKSKKIFTRVTPLNKLEIVESFKRQGEFVAVTGDGVNDAPAIKSANIGIAMGSGTDVAKETSSMIILDDNFNSIVLGIKEGRNAYSNIRKVSYMLLSCGVAEVLFFLLAIILDMPMPLVAIQLLWLNIVTDGLQDFALSFEKSEENIMKESPRNPKETLFNKELFSEVLISGLSIGIIVFIVWTYLINKLDMPVNIARGYIVTLMVFIQNMHVLNCRSEKSSILKVPIKSNPLIIFSIVSAIFLQVLFSEVPFLSKFLQTTSIPITHMLILFAISTTIIFIMEIYKCLKRKSIK
ncbi:MAG: HAD-IC family P-type ATPase [Bacilli bacterium]|nr:HAD-IC family P-type ATPase [bacterium]MDD6941719.1 HAD-IC family P-type ATPase [bacterium]MDY2697900.1 HAD-IC family P-type ATPase [Bacilli bacterium]